MPLSAEEILLGIPWDGYSTEERAEIERAIEIAREAHRGQVDKEGEPYELHVLSVAVSLAKQLVPPAVVAAGALHDALEDTELTAGKLRACGVTERTIEIVEALTHPDGEPYADYIERICAQDDWVVRVKLADVEHNWSRLSLLRDEPVRARLAKKYARTLPRLRTRLGMVG